MNINNCIADGQARIPVSYSLELGAAAAKLKEKHSQRHRGHQGINLNCLTSRTKVAVINTMTGLASPVAGTLGCLRNVCIWKPKAALFDLMNGIGAFLISPCVVSRNCCFSGRSSIRGWHNYQEIIHESGIRLPIDIGVICCFNCYAEMDRKSRYDQRMNLANRAYLKHEIPTSYDPLIFSRIIQMAFDTKDQNTIDFLEIRQFSKNEAFYLKLMNQFYYTNKSINDDGTMTEDELQNEEQQVDSLCKAMYYFLKNNPVLIYEFEKDFKHLTFAKFSTIHKFVEVRLRIKEFLREQIIALELPVVLKEMIMEYTEPHGITESEEERKEDKNESKRKIEIELDPEMTQIME